MQAIKLWAALLPAVLLLSGCGAGNAGAGQNTAEQSSTVNAAAVIDPATLFSDRDLDGSYDESAAVRIQLEGGTAACDSAAVTVEDSRITLREEGVYLLSGTLTDGQIVVDAGETDKVQIVLSGAEITCADSAALYALEADKVFLTLAEGTENTLANGGEYLAIDDNNIDAVVFAKTDLTLNGSGSLTIDAAAGHGVVSKDDLVITGGDYTVTAAGHGLVGKDSLSVAGGSFTVTSGKDGVRAENADDAALGSLYIAGGTFTVHAQGDAFSASGALQIAGGTFSLFTAGGSASVTMPTDSFGPGGMGGPASAGQEAADTEEEDTASTKGIKSDSTMTISGGSFTLDTADDGLHAGGDLLITAGDFSLSSGDDAIHSDSAVTIRGGSFSIPYCYEGIEGLSLTIDDGTFVITSCDDGLNAAGGADSSGFGGGRPEQFSDSTDIFITINGGTFTIVSEGDCIDSNGSLTVNGGVLDLTCNGNGDTALDADGSYANNGGTVTTNDGSEANPGGMGGGGQRGQMEGGQRPAGGRGEPPAGTKPEGEEAPPPL